MSQTGKKILVIVSVILLLALILIYGVRIQDIILKNIYPLEFQEYVYSYAEEKQVDPLLVFAIIKAESNFKKNAVSRSDAVGLMQLLPETAQEISEKEGYENIVKESLYDPEINIKIGIAYFKELLDRYHNIPVALAAYNAGMGNVDKWIANGTIKEDGSDIEKIPWKETNKYVRKIVRDYKIYQKLY